MLVLVERNIYVCKSTFCKEEKFFFFLIINLLWNENAIKGYIMYGEKN